MTGPGLRRRPGDAAENAALQRALAAENAAIFGYGVAGAHLAGRRRAAATAYWNEHRSARDRLAGLLRARGEQPAPAADAYKLPFAVHSAREEEHSLARPRCARSSSDLRFDLQFFAVGDGNRAAIAAQRQAGLFGFLGDALRDRRQQRVFDAVLGHGVAAAPGAAALRDARLAVTFRTPRAARYSSRSAISSWQV